MPGRGAAEARVSPASDIKGVRAMARRKVAAAKPKKIARRMVKRPIVRAVTNRPAQMKADPKVTAPHNGGWPELPPPSTQPWGAEGKAPEGVRILDFTHVQAGPTCTQLLAYMGADCIKIERPGAGDITRGQLRDVKGADSLYFTMLNGNKRSITI